MDPSKEYYRQPLRNTTKRPFAGEIDGSVENGGLPNGEIDLKSIIAVEKVSSEDGQLGQENKNTVPSEEQLFGAEEAPDLLMSEETAETLEALVEDMNEPSGSDPFVGPLLFSYKCPKCPSGFHIFIALKSHVEERHPGEFPLSCPLCHLKYSLDGPFWTHLKDRHGVVQPPNHPGGYRCDECGGHYHYRSHYASHCQGFRGKPHFYCQPCKGAFNDQDRRRHQHPNPKLHLRKKDVAKKQAKTVRFECSDCGKQCRSLKELQEAQGGTQAEAACLLSSVLEDSGGGWMGESPEDQGTRGSEAAFLLLSGVFRPEAWKVHQREESHVEKMESDKAHPFKCPVEKCGRPFQLARQLKAHMAAHPGPPSSEAT